MENEIKKTENDFTVLPEKPVVRLENWVIIGNVAYGDAYGHPRFPNGHEIRTSRIVQNCRTDILPKLVTLNTIYMLGKHAS